MAIKKLLYRSIPFKGGDELSPKPRGNDWRQARGIGFGAVRSKFGGESCIMHQAENDCSVKATVMATLST